MNCHLKYYYDTHTHTHTHTHKHTHSYRWVINDGLHIPIEGEVSSMVTPGVLAGEVEDLLAHEIIEPEPFVV